MSLTYHPFKAPNGVWHVVYSWASQPGVVTSVADCPNEAAAKSGANKAQREHDRMQRTPPPTNPYDRHIPRGFYTDGDAA